MKRIWVKIPKYTPKCGQNEPNSLMKITFKLIPNIKISIASRLVMSKGNKSVTAQVVHFEAGVVLQACTSEWALKKHLYRQADTSAYINLGRVSISTANLILFLEYFQKSNSLFYPTHIRYSPSDASKQEFLKWIVPLNPHQMANSPNSSISSKTMASHSKNPKDMWNGTPGSSIVWKNHGN